MAVFWMCVLGCGSESTPAADAGEGDTGENACASSVFEDGDCLPTPVLGTPSEECPSGEYEEGICLPMAPTPPTPPQLADWSCPEGWESRPMPIEDLGLAPRVYCVPPPHAENCPARAFPVVGRADCALIGIECPAGGAAWHDETRIRERAPEHTGRIWYADSGAGAGAATREVPTSLSDAVSRAAAGDIVALAVGTYTATVEIAAGIALLGSCPESTRISPTGTGAEPVVRIGGAGPVHVGDLTVSGPRTGILVESTREGATLQSLVVENSAFPALGFVQSAGENVVTDVLVRGTRTDPAELQFAVVAWDSRVVARRLSVLGSRATGAIDVSGAAASFEAEDLLIADTTPPAAGQLWGMGIIVGNAASLSLDRAALRGNHTYGIYAVEQATVDLTEIEVSETQPAQYDGTGGEGIRIESRATLGLERAYLARNHYTSLLASGVGTSLEAADLFVEDTLPDLGASGTGISLEAGAVGHVARAVFRNSRDRGVDLTADPSLGEAGAELHLEDAVVIDTGSPDEDAAGLASGLIVWSSSIVAERVVIARTDGGGVTVQEASEVTLRDVEVIDTFATARQREAVGVLDDSPVLLERVRIRRAAGCGICAFGHPNLQLVDVDLEGITPSRDGFRRGFGVWLIEPDAVIARMRIADVMEAGLVADAGRLEVTDLAIEAVRRPGHETFSAAFIQDSGETGFSRLAVRDGDVIGVHIWFGAFSGTDLLIAQPGRAGLALIASTGAIGRAAITSTQLLALYLASERPGDVEGPFLGRTSDATISDLVIRGVGPAPEWTFDLPDDQATFAAGLGIEPGSQLGLERFLVTGCETVGLLVLPDGRVQAADGLIASNAIGLNVQNPAIDLASAFVRVRSVGNVTDRSFDALATPALDSLFGSYGVDEIPQ